MKFFTIMALSSLLLPRVASASFNLNVKIGHTVGNQKVEVSKTVKANYNEEIVISSDGLKNKIVLNLKKIEDVEMNGSKISPVQVDMKLINEMQKIIGRPQTVTSFYKNSAQFEVRSSGIPGDTADLNVSLNFEETN